MKRKNSKGDATPGTVFKVGAIALAFLVIGYQSALFIHRAATLRIESLRDRPDTVYVIDEALAARLLDYSAVRTDSSSRQNNPLPPVRKGQSHSGVALPPAALPVHKGQSRSGVILPGAAGGNVIIRRNSGHSERVEQVRRATRQAESFRFNPNTVSVEDLVRLGFTEKQAQAIDNYRAAGGRFRRASDFAKSYVVSDSVFRRLEPFIDIPRLDINRADSAAFDALPGIGPYFAAKMVSYRKRLGGYSFKEQLMDIYNFDREKYDALSDLITCSKPQAPFRLWTLPADSLRLHPYIRDWQTARSIVLFRNNTPPAEWSVEALAAAGILPEQDAAKLAKCSIEVN